MYCPKCATENPDNCKFCRSCRANLSSVLAAIDGELSFNNGFPAENKEKYSDIYTAGIRNVILGMGLLTASIFVKTMPGDSYLWLLLMIPAVLLTASGIPKIIKAEAIKKEKEDRNKRVEFPVISAKHVATALPSVQTEYISPNSKFKTNDLVITPSVTEETTDLLEMRSENETMTLKKV